MTDISAQDMRSRAIGLHGQSPGVVLRSIVIGLTAFLTVVDLFATQAILPSLTRHYQVTPAAMGFAVNATTMGMAAAGLIVGLFSPRIDRRLGILLSLAVLAVPTGLLAFAPNLTVFTFLRIAQGLCMASAFTLTLAYLGEQCSATDAGGAFAAYITGNVASNLIGRLVSAALADTFGLASNFYFFALLNLAGAVLVYFTIERVKPMQSMGAASRPAGAHFPKFVHHLSTHLSRTSESYGHQQISDSSAAFLFEVPEQNSPLVVQELQIGGTSAAIEHWRNPPLRAAFGIGFCILFAFIGTFTYVNFALVRPPLSLGMMELGLVYFVFLPSIVTTLLAGRAVVRFGTRPAIWGALVLAALGLPLLLATHVEQVLTGMVLVGVGTFFAQAAATGFVGQAAQENRGVASGLYLACYFCGGLVGSAILGQLFDRFGWTACVAGVMASLLVAALLTARLEMKAFRN
jgi:MFS transporter, YNFM family, putative membrane transport protein